MNEFFYNSLSEIERQIFDRYKGNQNSFCYDLNNALRANDFNNFQSDIDILDGIISKHQIDTVLVLHRATNEHLVLPFITDSCYNNPEYLSTATDLESIENHFTNPDKPVYLKLTCKVDTSIAPFEGNSQFDGMENEMLIGRNNKFYVNRTRLTSSRGEIESIMGRFYAQNVATLRIIEAQNFDA